MSVHAGKTLLTMILNGGSIPTAHEKVRYLQSLRKASRLLRMLACTQLPDVWAALRDEGRKWLDWINRESSGKDGGINRICSLVTVCLFVPCTFSLGWWRGVVHQPCASSAYIRNSDDESASLVLCMRTEDVEVCVLILRSV
jgi:hypothetical protein